MATGWNGLLDDCYLGIDNIFFRWVGWWGDGKEVQEGGDICIHRADSRCRTAETIILIHHINLWLPYVQAFI